MFTLNFIAPTTFVAILKNVKFLLPNALKTKKNASLVEPYTDTIKSVIII